MKIKIFLLNLVFFISCSEKVNLKEKPIETRRSVAPLLTTPEIQAKVKEREESFSWKKDISEFDYNRIMSLKDTPENRKSFEAFISNQSLKKSLRFFYLLRLMAFEINQNKHSEALKVLEKNLSEFPEFKKDLDELVALLKETNENVQTIDQGPEVNSNDSYLPIPELSEKKLYYTSQKTSGAKGGEDILEVSNVGGTWKEKKFLTSINSSTHDSACSVSADGTELVLFGNYPGSLGSGDLFISKLTSQGWSKPENLGYPINSSYFDSDGIFTPDGKAFLFVSDRPGGYFKQASKNKYNAASYWGNTDIYVSFIDENGNFGIPINLGPMVNTPGAERTPFLHPDGKTLYFSSNGYNVNFGDLDIYKTVRLDDTWTNWSEPINIGKELNTTGADWGFKLTASSDKGYMSRFNVTKNQHNIFAFVPLPKRAKPAGTVIAIEGKIIDENGTPLEADIEWENLDTSEKLGKLKSKPLSGEFFITLPLGNKYAYFARKSGYVSQSQSIDLTKEKNYSVKKIEITLVSIQTAKRTGQEIVLGNILFESDKSLLDKRSFPELDRLIQILKQNPEIKIEIQGHTSTGRIEDFNLKLSQERADAVANYLLEKGIEKERIQAKGYGSSKPIAPNTTEANKAKNRRVSFKILGNE